MCERATGLSSLFTADSLQDQLAHCLSPLMGSTVCKVNCPNSDLNEAGGALKMKSDSLNSM